MTLTEWFFKDPEKALTTMVTIGAVLVGSLGWLVAKVVDGERHPRIYQAAKAAQNIGASLPAFFVRMSAFFKALKPSEQPTPPEGKTL